MEQPGKLQLMTQEIYKQHNKCYNKNMNIKDLKKQLDKTESAYKDVSMVKQQKQSELNQVNQELLKIQGQMELLNKLIQQCQDNEK